MDKKNLKHNTEKKEWQAPALIDLDAKNTSTTKTSPSPTENYTVTFGNLWNS